MIDYSVAEIVAIEKSFSDISVYICDFHKIQAWQRCSKSSKNDLSHDDQKEFLRLMQQLAYPETATHYNKKLRELKESNV